MSEAPLLAVKGLNAWYGESHVLHGVDFEVRAGEVVSLLGRNGAGKSTCISSIVGFVRPRSGAIRLDGEDLTRSTPEAICRGGIGLVPVDHLVGRATFRFWSTDGSASWINPISWFSALRGGRMGKSYNE